MAFSKHRGSESLQIIDIMLAAVSVWLMVTYFDTQIAHNEVIALFRRSPPLGFVAVLQIQSFALWFFKSSPYKFTDCNVQILSSIYIEDLTQVTK